MKTIACFLSTWATQVEGNAVRFLSHLEPFTIPVIKIWTILMRPHFIWWEEQFQPAKLPLFDLFWMPIFARQWSYYWLHTHLLVSVLPICSSAFDVSISTFFLVKLVYSSYILNDNKPKTLADGRFPAVFSRCWFLKARKYRIFAFSGAVHSQWELSANVPEANILLDIAVLNWSRD